MTDEDVLANFGGKDGPELRKAAREAADYIITKKLDAIEPIEWRTTEPEKPIGDVTVVLHMDDTPDGAVVLRFDAIRTQRLDASEKDNPPQTEALPEIPPWEMYASKDNSRDTNGQTSLRNAIVNHVINHFDKGFQESFRKAVLLLIPLVREGKGIEIDNNKKQFAFILPVAWSMLRPLPKTFFCVTFTARLAQEWRQAATELSTWRQANGIQREPSSWSPRRSMSARFIQSTFFLQKITLHLRQSAPSATG